MKNLLNFLFLILFVLVSSCSVGDINVGNLGNDDEQEENQGEEVEEVSDPLEYFYSYNSGEEEQVFLAEELPVELETLPLCNVNR